MLCPARLAPLATGTEEPNVLRIIAAAHRPWNDVVVLDELLRSAGPTPSTVPFIHETFHGLRNRLCRMGIKLPLDALLISALQHREKRPDVLGSTVTRLPVEVVPPPPPLATIRTCHEYGKVTLVVPRTKLHICVGTKLARRASRAGEPDSVAPEKSSTVSPEPSVSVPLQIDAAIRGMADPGEASSVRSGARLPKSRGDRYQDDHERGTQQGSEERDAQRRPENQERDDADARGRDALANV
jgi:hypothetical protein